ncbi:solute:sodium symporter family transporter [Pseudobacter ginsenosidimutans]|uniref:SSS family solute:Na+ symporter n=1 Tax=Pseudobacter ginsenosidimutans TaxID=661488 RepID=A0A4Q7MZ99_9BACT|nr:solute:sodium symporter family transporter [Pseudobacter ginsenosidimutans]QEC42861.1 solute:sodium symporter family transporter [Pseudobacter ginsenosidimutans]RZS74212.1 SSS family solute:Na+ symporter [Pseudobacter ginsenosidimutans]
MNLTILLSFLFVTVAAALVSIYVTRRKKQQQTPVGFYLGNRSLGFWMIGSSMFLTNMSANQFIGENEFVYTTNMSVMAWGMSSVLAMLLVAEFLMPMYLRIGAVTTPDFLAKRFDVQTQRIVSIIFLLGYFVNLIPTVLYGCAVAINGIFHVDSWLGISYFSAIQLIVLVVGVVGALYNVLGGLRAITITDVVQGIGMLIGGSMIVYYGFRFLGDGDVWEGVRTLSVAHKDHLNAIGGPKDVLPFSTIFTGMLLVNIYYWGMEQYIVQEALASKNLAESQKGISLAVVGKLFAPLLLNVPGLIAVHLYPNLENTATAFPRLVSDILPPVFIGLVAAVVFGGALSTFNAGLNSTGTLFTMNLYKPWLERNGAKADERKLLRNGKILQVCVTILAIIFSPYIMYFEGGFYNYLQKVSSFFSVPVFTIMVIGLLTKRVPPLAAKVGILFFVTVYTATQFLFDLQLHYLHVLAILFLVTSGIMLLIGRLRPMESPFQLPRQAAVDIVPWKRRHLYYAILLALMVGMFILFSPPGIAG